MSNEACDTLRAEFAGVDKSAIELRAEAREAALELAGRSTDSTVEADED